MTISKPHNQDILDNNRSHVQQNFYSDSATDAGYFAARDQPDSRYRSGVHFQDFLSRQQAIYSTQDDSCVIDFGCGTGSETVALARAHPRRLFVGIDINERFIATARARYPDENNVKFFVREWLDALTMEEFANCTHAISQQCLSWLPWYEDPLRAMCAPPVQRVSFSTLAWEGPFDSKVQHLVSDDPSASVAHYNVYSIPRIIEFMKRHQFALSASHEFQIDIDLPVPSEPRLGSYTVRDEDGRRMVFSAWQHLPLVFFHFERFESRKPTI